MQHISTLIHEHAIKGFLAQDEGEALWKLASKIAHIGPCLEIGSYCGKSTVYLGDACKQTHNTLYAVDHHRGSEEHQLGEEYHDPDLYNAQAQAFDSFPTFRRTLDVAQLNDHVIPIVSSSSVTRQHWQTPLGMVFIDGGHSHDMARDDCTGWAKHILPGGYLAVHDIFEKPEEGGQGPYLALQAVLKTGNFALHSQINSLGILQRL